MSDYPDGTMPVSIIAQAIADLAVDIVAQTIGNLAVDIAAQTLAALGVDITAQSVGNLAVDIAAQTLASLGINIKAQDLAELVIKISAQTIGLKIEAEWQTQQGNQKYFRASAANVASGTFTATNYTVTTGKTLYITHFGGGAMPVNAADFNKVFSVYLFLYNNTTATQLVEMVKNIGGAATFPTPIKVPSGEVFRYGLMSRSGFNIDQFVTAGGYEI